MADEGIKAKLGLNTEEFESGLLKAMTEVSAFSDKAQKDLGGIGDKASGVALTTEASTQKQTQSWGRVNTAIAGIAVASTGIFKSMVENSPSLSVAFAEMNFMFSETFMILGESLAPLIEKTLIPLVQNLTSFINGLNTKTQTTIAISIGLIAMISSVVSVFGIFGVSVSSVSGIVGGFSGVLSALLGPVGLVILAIVALYVAWQTNFGGIQDVFFSTVDSIKDRFDLFVSDNQENFDIIFSGLKTLGSALLDLWVFISPVVEAIANLLWNVLAATFRVVFDYMLDIITDFLTFFAGMIDVIVSIVNAITGRGGLEEIKDAFATLFTGIINLFIDFLNIMLAPLRILGEGLAGWSVAPDWLVSVGNLLADIEVPRLHGGGVVPGERGKEVMIKALGGELVYNPMLGQSPPIAPASHSQTINNTINIYNPVVSNRDSKNQLFKEIDRHLRRTQNKFPKGRTS